MPEKVSNLWVHTKIRTRSCTLFLGICYWGNLSIDHVCILLFLQSGQCCIFRLPSPIWSIHQFCKGTERLNVAQRLKGSFTAVQYFEPLSPQSKSEQLPHPGEIGGPPNGCINCFLWWLWESLKPICSMNILTHSFSPWNVLAIHLRRSLSSLNYSIKKMTSFLICLQVTIDNIHKCVFLKWLLGIVVAPNDLKNNNNNKTMQIVYFSIGIASAI